MKKVIVFILSVLMLAGCAQSAAPADIVCIEAAYPPMAPYPNEEDFVDSSTGLFDSEGFSKVYDAWRGNNQIRQDVPEGYAHNLEAYFQQALPALLNQDAENQVCSPLNVYLALAMLAESTSGASRQEILDLLDSDSIESLRLQANRIWRSHYSADGASACVLANSLWLNSALTYDKTTVKRLTDDYYASVFQGPMGSPEINQALQDWISRQTDGLLQEPARNLNLDPQTALALASTIYYRAKWGNEFSADDNTEALFHAPSGGRKVTFMNRQLTYGPYFWGDGFGAVYLWLEGGAKMWLILPDEGKTPAQILAGGQAARLVLGSWQESGAQKALRVNLSLPKFDVLGSTRLNDALQSLGIRTVFSPEAADFSPILPGQAAWLGTADHAARVKIDEEGVEAAAYTVMMAPGAAMPPEDEMDFVLDRPFLFVITSRDDLPLFAGIVNEP